MPNKKINGLFLSIENNNVVFFQVFEKFGISFSTVNFFDEKRMIMDLKKYHVIFVDFSFLFCQKSKNAIIQFQFL